MTLEWVNFFTCTIVLITTCSCLENNLARTPPMGWLSWTRFMCQVDCVKYPTTCISENLFIQMADIMVKEGYRDAGYNFVNIDDCWMSKKRDADQRLVADPERFPKGIKWLAEYMHGKGLKLGIYENYGEFTCMGYPGSQDHMKIDADTILSWDVDMLKFDGCFTDPLKMDDAYPQMGSYFNLSGRNLVYSCSWPYYIRKELRKEPNYELISRHCNLWRNYDDIQIHWKSIEFIIDFYDQYQDVLSKYHGPGHWNDPDMIIIGNPGLTPDQCRAQMAIWAIWSAPLLMSNDLRDLRPEFKEILLNRKVIAIDQDKLGIMGKKIKEFANGRVSLYKKMIAPIQDGAPNSYAIVLLNKDDYQVKIAKFSLSSIGLNFAAGYFVDDLFAPEPPKGAKHRKIVQPDDQLELAVPPTGVIMWRLDVVDWSAGEQEGVSDWSIPGGRNARWFYIFIAFILVCVYFRRSRIFRFFWRRLF